ncbi:hypothetical protein PINS_up014547 [Pythium insidiosum]|nr:hypothetical protein PINS_up014547 [Pythium insidiosum]
MGRATRKKRRDEQQRLYFTISGDSRNAKARAMLDALQQKLVDDALREDGFYFVDGRYTDARRPRVTPGMRSQSYKGHKRRLGAIAVVPLPPPDVGDTDSVVVTFGLDQLCTVL